jgi:quaternary ammonium compound-resistance protein SugE
MVISFLLLARALKTIRAGAGYAVCTGNGAVGATVMGRLDLGELRSAARVVCALPIVAWIVGLKRASSKSPPADGRCARSKSYLLD